MGVTGLPGSGKGTFVEILRQILAAQQIQTTYYSLSDMVRSEARRQGLPIERPVLRQVANELRQQQGSGVLSKMVLQQIAADNVPAGLIIIDAIRNPEEVRLLRRQLSNNFFLVAVEAPLELLIERVMRRGRSDEVKEVTAQRELAQRMILGESGTNEPAHGHNIAECIQLADWHIDNSQSLATLTEEAKKFADQISQTTGFIARPAYGGE